MTVEEVVDAKVVYMRRISGDFSSGNGDLRDMFIISLLDEILARERKITELRASIEIILGVKDT